jgi:TRAP-type C4-dicarboxylate transport system substrate-binding protein
MKTRVLTIGVCVILAIGLLIGCVGCSGETVTETVTNTTTVTPGQTTEPTTTTTTEPVETTKLTLACFQAEKSYWVPAVKQWAADFEEATGGRYEIEMNFGGGMGAAGDYYNMLTNGVFDFTLWQPAMSAGRFPVCEMMTLPVAAPTVVSASQAFRELQLKGYVEDDFSDSKLLFVFAASGQIIANDTRLVETLDDIKGLKIGNSGGYAIDVLNAMGAVPVDMPVSERYMSIEKGLLNGTLGTYSAIRTYNLFEVVHYVSEPGLCSFPFTFVMNKDTYENMPADVQEIVDAMIQDDKYSMMAAEAGDADINSGKKLFTDNNGTIGNWNPAEFAKIGQNLVPLWEKTIADLEKAGVPAEDIATELYDIMVGIGIENPFAGYVPDF